MATSGLLLGEYTRSLDERHRLSIPAELSEPLLSGAGECLLAKQQQGALSLWNLSAWQHRLDQATQLIAGKLAAGKLDERTDDVQRLGRLLSTRARKVALAGRSRLVIPEGFREFLAVEPGGEVFVVGAAVCVELWNPAAWLSFVSASIGEFPRLLDELSG